MRGREAPAHGPPASMRGLSHRPDLQGCKECSSIFSAREGRRGLFSPPLPFATNSLWDKGNEGPRRRRGADILLPNVLRGSHASSCTEDREDEHQEGC